MMENSHATNATMLHWLARENMFPRDEDRRGGVGGSLMSFELKMETEQQEGRSGHPQMVQRLEARLLGHHREFPFPPESFYSCPIYQSTFEIGYVFNSRLGMRKSTNWKSLSHVIVTCLTSSHHFHIISCLTWCSNPDTD